MKTNIYSNNLQIGFVDLRINDESMGGVGGSFVPNENYSKIKDKVLKFNASEEKDFNLWNSLRFNAQLENGYFLHPMGGIMIYDFPELQEEKPEIGIAGVFRHVIDDYFKTEPPRIFVEEPWEDITIDQKIAFENELKKEIGQDNVLINRLIGSKKKHLMTEYEFSALCTSCRSDDVLFSIYSDRNLDYDFALVHLTWKQKQEIDNYPITEFFKDFDDFKYNQMTPDKIEWEE